MWFDKRKQQDEKQLEVEKKSSIEIVAHKKASKDVVRQAEEINKKLKNLLVENHFTLKIFLATGGKKEHK